MGRPEEEKKDDRICVAVPGSVAAWVRDRARFIGKSPSELCFDWIIERLHSQEGLRKSSDGKPEVAVNHELLKTALEALQKMIESGPRPQVKRGKRLA